MASERIQRACLFGGALLAAGLASQAEAQFVIGNTTHDSGLTPGAYVSGYAGMGDYTLASYTGPAVGPTMIESSFPTGTLARCVLGDDEISGTAEKVVNSFAYFAFNTSFTVLSDTDVTVSWDVSTAIPALDRRFSVRESGGPTLFEYDEMAGPHNGETTISLTAGTQYIADSLIRSVFANGNGSFSLMIESSDEPCDGDANGDTVVDVNDISYVLFRLGDPCAEPGCDGDANGDGVVDVNDISYVLFRLGDPCE